MGSARSYILTVVWFPVRTAFGAEEAVRVHFQIHTSQPEGLLSRAKCNSARIDHRSEIAKMPLNFPSFFNPSAFFRVTIVPFPCGFPAAYGKHAWEKDRKNLGQTWATGSSDFRRWGTPSLQGEGSSEMGKMLTYPGNGAPPYLAHGIPVTRMKKIGKTHFANCTE